MILVDESGSLSTSDVDREKAAASLLAVGELSPNSEVAVVGFGSSDQEGQSAVDPVCPLTERNSTANQEFLLNCITKLHRRSIAEGNGTDHVAALNQALGILREPDALQRPKIILVLTDGVLDVHNSPGYGTDPDQRNANAQALLTNSFTQARELGAPIWPLGFGGGISPSALAGFAAGGAQGTCNSQPDAKPHYVIVHGSDDVIEALIHIFASARCAQVGPFGSANLASGSTVDIRVAVPDVSTDGSIVVLKGDPRVQVTYLDPTGRPVPRTGRLGNSTFDVSAQNGAAESLHIVNPIPGTWTVRLTAGPDVPPSKVVAAVVWQGVVQSVIVVSPPSPRAGQTVAVRVRVRTRTGTITDPDQLRQLTFRATMEGASAATTNIPLNDDGIAPDLHPHDGEYAGNVTVPQDATGNLTFSATVDGAGVAPVSLRFDTQVATGPPPLTAEITLPTGRVKPGTTVSGSLLLDDVDGSAHTVRLLLDQLDAGTLATLAGQTTIRVTASGRTTYPIAVTLAPGTRLGSASGRIRLVDAADPDTVYGQSFLGVRVGYPPPWWHRLWWLWTLLGVLLVAAVAAGLARRAAVRRGQEMRGLSLVLYRDESELHRMNAPAGREMRFTVREPSGLARLDRVGAGEPAYVARRGRDGLVVTRPGGRVLTLRGGKPTALDGDLALGYTSTSPGSARPRAYNGLDRDPRHRGGSLREPGARDRGLREPGGREPGSARAGGDGDARERRPDPRDPSERRRWRDRPDPGEPARGERALDPEESTPRGNPADDTTRWPDGRRVRPRNDPSR